MPHPSHPNQLLVSKIRPEIWQNTMCKLISLHESHNAGRFEIPRLAATVGVHHLTLMPERATLANTARRGFVLNQSLEMLAAVLASPDGRQAGSGTQRASLGSVLFSHAMEGIMAGQVAARKKARKEAANPVFLYPLEKSF